MSRPSVYLETFGCQMNELDSELVAGQLHALGYRFVDEPEGAQVILYNTCSVREHAEQKVWSRLGELAIRKQDDPALVVGVLGCLAERDGVALVKRMPVVDVLCGPGELDKLPSLLDNAYRTRQSLLSDRATATDADRRSASQVALQGNSSRRSATLAAAQDSLEMLDLSRATSPLDTMDEDHPSAGAVRKRSAYVRITRGCNKFCTYCVVPFTRGAEVHRPPEHIIDECKKLADAGVIEITLLGQTVNHYRFEHGAAVTIGGVVQPQKGRSYAGGHRRDPFAGSSVTTFADLLSRIHEEVASIERLRFVTSYPRDFGDDVLEVIRDHPRVCRYLHVPAQSGSDRVLKLMNRGYTVAEYLEFVDRARGFLHEPEKGRPLSISGDIIVGFPTETEADFEATIGLIERVRYKNCFIFKYSPRPGTTAFDKLDDDVPDAIKRRWNNTALDVQSRISDELSRESIGRTLDVFVEGLSRMEEKKRERPAKACGGGVSLTIGGKVIHSHADEDDEDCGCSAPEAGEPSAATTQLSGRTDGDHIVFFDVPSDRRAEELIGSIVPVRIERVQRLSLFGRLSGQR
ncbi:MAG: MiaB/RimO family radical SAM methylthiotransferase [Phycisphaerales bacterium]|jgi:tRNA-2-methylthio-N6-dimethylallyladenosine synthase|nr:MiaB/RimO family radical SAM methylthiotransferase [Phycisphaerales bacterium]